LVAAGALAALEASANVIPTNSSISAGLPSASEAAYIFRWGVRRLSCAKGTPGPAARSLLMLAMPHHVDAGVRGSGGVAKGIDGAFKQLLGPYTGEAPHDFCMVQRAATWSARCAALGLKVWALRAGGRTRLCFVGWGRAGEEERVALTAVGRLCGDCSHAPGQLARLLKRTQSPGVVLSFGPLPCCKNPGDRLRYSWRCA
jgi:hypothetical protein